jgi:hypothetical protein
MNSENLEERLDEFAETHGAVLLGMHKDVTTLKSEVAATLAKHSAEIQKMADDIAAKQHATCDEMQSKLYGFAARQDKLLTEANTVLDKTIQGYIKVGRRQEQLDAAMAKAFAKIESEFQMINAEAKRHQAEVDKFKKTTRIIAIAALTLMIGVVVWLALRAWK